MNHKLLRISLIPLVTGLLFASMWIYLTISSQITTKEIFLYGLATLNILYTGCTFYMTLAKYN